MTRPQVIVHSSRFQLKANSHELAFRGQFTILALANLKSDF